VLELLSLATHRPLAGIVNDVARRIGSVHRDPVGAPLHASPVADGMQCFSDYEPRSVAEASLKKLVISGLAPDSGTGTANAGKGNHTIAGPLHRA
jgi:hypothetical protein